MISSNSSSRYLSVTGGHIDSLISYVLDVKPYHSKLSEVVEEFLFEDHVGVKITEQHRELVVLGPDYLKKGLSSSLKVWDKIGSQRPIDTLSAERTIISDGVRKTFPVPLTCLPKLASDSSASKFIIGQSDDHQIVGLPYGVYSPKRFDGIGIPKVTKNNRPLAEGVDYHISHGAFSFNTLPGSKWKELNISSLNQFAQNPGELAIDNVYENFGSIVDIVATSYEEFTLTYNGSALVVVGSASGQIGIAQFGQRFVSSKIEFTFAPAYGDNQPPYIVAGNSFLLTPRSQITVGTNAPAETWTIIKTNPQALVNAPIFARTTSSASLGSTPSLSIYTNSLEWTPATSWIINFTSATQYTISAQKSSAQLTGYPKTVDLTNGCSFKDEFIHFTIIPPLNGFASGDKFIFNVNQDKPNYLVYGSVSGWQPPAQVGKWYWNGKIGFKIPTLDYFAVRRSSSVSVSSDLIEWTSAIASGQELTNITFMNGAFIASGAKNIVAQSTDGRNWSDDFTDFVTNNEKLIIIGDDGLVAETSDGLTWRRVATNTNNKLKGLAVIPTGTASTNVLIAVGGAGTIITSISGLGWVQRNSTTTNNLNAVSFNSSIIVAVGDNGTILTSTDRIVWTQSVSPTIVNLNKVKFLNGAFFAVGNNGTIIKSADGIVWQTVASHTSAELNDIAYGNGMYIAVGKGGYSCVSSDGINFSASQSKPINAIEFSPIANVFVTVEHKVAKLANFTPIRPIHSVTSPSMYTLIFRPPVNGSDVVGGTVQHNIEGFKTGFKTNQNWFDEHVGFKIGPAEAPYKPGEQIDIYLAPRAHFVVRGNYDDLPYDSSPYESNVGKFEYPLDLLQEYFPLYHSHGSVIIPSISQNDVGQQVEIDKATFESVQFRLGKDMDTVPGELAAVNGWIPLEFRTFDRRVLTNSVAEFPDLASYVDAYLASDPSTKVFTISQPRYKTTSRPASATITFDDAFFSRYIPERKIFSLQFNQTDSHQQKVVVKVTENLRIYARVRLNFDEAILIKLDDLHTHYYTSAQINETEAVRVTVEEGGLFIKPDVSIAVDEPVVEVKDNSAEVAGTKFAEGLQIVVVHTAPAQVGYESYPYDSMPYDYTDETPIGEVVSMSIAYDKPMYVSVQADEYVVTYKSLGHTPTVIIEPDNGPAFVADIAQQYNQVYGATIASFSFSVPQGTGPFRLTLS